MKKVVFIKNTLILSASALVLRLAGVAFKIWLSAKIGSEAIGLYQVLMSVYIFAGSFASSGICTAVTRLTTESLLQKSGVRRVVNKGIELTAIISAVTFAAIYLSAKPLAAKFVGDTRAVLPLRIMAAGLLFVGICSCLRGYFLARRNALSSSVSQIIEQIVRIAVISLLLYRFGGESVTTAICAIVIGDAASEAAATLFLWVLYRLDVGGREDSSHKGDGTTKKLIKIAAPISAGRYLSTWLRSIESGAVPQLLVSFGLTSSEALSLFGIVKGMALPLLLFPSAVLSAVSLLLIPELSEASAKSFAGVKATVSVVIKITTLLSYLVGAVFWFCGEALGQALYSDATAGHVIKLLAPLTPLMYIDSIADGMLKGLDKQAAAFRYAVLDSGLRLILIFLILPRYGFNGFIFIMYLSNILTAFLHLRTLLLTAKLKLSLSEFLILPLFFAVSACAVVATLLSLIKLPVIIFLILFCSLAAALYLALLWLTGLISREKLLL